ncbi:hypothetical protein KCP69_16995 [Salmonella enterica subsp. enterica]|nr:hypothetical protein KCP69_16995 [Salmonella enterica subsp. enterica]
MPSAPQLALTRCTLRVKRKKAGMTPVDYTVKSLKEGFRFALPPSSRKR